MNTTIYLYIALLDQLSSLQERIVIIIMYANFETRGNYK